MTPPGKLLTLPLLTLDCSTSVNSVAIARDAGHPIIHEVVSESSGSERDIHRLVGAALDKAGLSPAECASFGIGLGPGSFSGIRAALAFLHGMALPSGAPLAGVSGAAAMALSAFERDPALSEALVVGDARRGRLWIGAFARASEGILTLHPLRLIPRNALADTLDSLPPNIRILSPDFERLDPFLGELLPQERLLRNATPRADAVAKLLLTPGAPRVIPPLPIYLHSAV